MSIDSAQRIIKKIHISISVNSTGKSNSGLLTSRKIDTSLPYTKKGVEERKVRKEEKITDRYKRCDEVDKEYLRGK